MGENMRISEIDFKKLCGTEFQNSFNRVGAISSTRSKMGSLEKGGFD